MDITDASLNTDYQTALSFLKAQQYREAIKVCRKILKIQPYDHRVINLMAICSHYQHKYKTAVKLFAIINKLSPNNMVYLNNQGSILSAQGDVEGAIGAYKQAIASSETNFEAYINLAKLHEQIDQPIHALEYYNHILKLDPDNIHTLLNSGALLQKMNQQQTALQVYQKIVQLQPDNITALFGIATILQSLEQNSEAIQVYQKILQLNPKHIPSYINLGVAYKKNENYDAAIACYKAAIEIDPKLDYLYINLANALKTIHCFKEAIDNYQQALALNPTSASAYSGLGYAQYSLGDYIAAEKNFDKAIDIDLNHVDAHFNRALNFLIQGKFKQGWPEYEWRMRKPEMIFLLKKFPYPLWDGSPLGNKTLMIITEQGYSDNIQFIRYVPLINKQQGKIILASHPELLPLFRQIPHIDQFNLISDLISDVNVFIPLLSLPMVMNTTLNTIPASIPYLQPEAKDVEEAKKLFPQEDNSLRVGICHQSNLIQPQHQGCNLEQFTIFVDNHVHLYNLHKWDSFPDNMPITDLTHHLDDFRHTAAVIACLDLVICVDTAIAHLAGAMGKPVWNILPFNPDWRWMADREDTPWYPTMRLYRQTKPNAWDDVFKQIQKDLKKFKKIETP